MKERPILFSGPMVRAILDGRKTQTRRVLHRNKLYNGFAFDDPRIVRACPYGQPGDRLWIRETWRPCAVPQCSDTAICVEYRASDYCKLGHLATLNRKGWRPSIFTPRWASRITLEIVDVRVERVQDITREDAIAEGTSFVGFSIGRGNELPDPRPVFAALWDDINAPRGYSWASNPWVWVLTFKRVIE